MIKGKKNVKRRIGMLGLVLAISISATAQAQEMGEGNSDGVGELEGIVKTDVYQVVMPTETEGIFDFILDPQGLINATGGAAYEGKKFEKDSTVFFKRTDGTVEEDYSNKSDYITITNKSSVPVDVSVEVQVDTDSIKGIILSDDKEFKDDTGRSLYLAITDGENVVPVGKDGATLQATIDAVPEEAYEFVYENEKYVYKMKEGLEGIEFPEYSFQLMGAANGKGEWTELVDVAPKIMITWKVM